MFHTHRNLHFFAKLNDFSQNWPYTTMKVRFCQLPRNVILFFTVNTGQISGGYHSPLLAGKMLGF